MLREPDGVAYDDRHRLVIEIALDVVGHVFVIPERGEGVDELEQARPGRRCGDDEFEQALLGPLPHAS